MRKLKMRHCRRMRKKSSRYILISYLIFIIYVVKFNCHGAFTNFSDLFLQQEFVKEG
jgi:hypothetical protein